MNYAGTFDATASKGPATHSHAYVHVDSSQVHAPADALIVPDAQLLFHGDFKRTGNDLILSKDHHDFVLHDYFKGEKRAAIASPDGAHLTADIIKALVGEVHVSQAGNAQLANQVIGHVTKLQGSATVVRNGVSIILNMGDNVEKGDVVESGSNSTLGLTFIDGTVFGLSANARMVLNEMVYDPNGSSNSSLMSLVAGTITFVAGETAKHGDMKVDTPVATMGIRGTACLVEIDFTVPGVNQSPAQVQPASGPSASFQVLVEPDGTTGSYILFDKTTLQPIAIVNQAGQQLNIANGVISQTTTPLSPEIQKLITDVFQQKFSDNTNSNTKTTTAQTDSIIPTSNGFIIKLADGSIAQAFNANTGAGSLDPNVAAPSNNFNHLSGFLKLDSLGLVGLAQVLFQAAELAGQTGDTFDFAHVGGTFHFEDINVGDRPSVSADFSSVTYTNASGSFNVNAGQTSAAGLSALQFKDIADTAIKLFLVPSPGNKNNGDVTWIYAVRDNAFDFLAAGEKLTFTYHVVLDNNFAAAPESKGLDITITVTGTNDKPQFSTDTPAPEIDFAAGTKTSGGDLPTNNPTSGSLAFTDVDLTDKHTVSVLLTDAKMSNGGNVPPLPLSLFNDPKTLTVSIQTDSTGTGNGVIHWQLAALPVYVADFIPANQTVTLTYTVTLTDSSGDLTTDSTTQTITVVITGTNDAAEVWIHTTTDENDNKWTTGANWETGLAPSATDDAIIITDQLHPNTPAYPATVDVTTAVAHSLTMNDFAAQSTDPAHQAPELDVLSGAILTIGADVSLGADSKLVNFGTVIVGGKLELMDAVDPQTHEVSLNLASIENCGTLDLGQGGDIQGTATVTNAGLIDLKGGMLNVLVDIANSKNGYAGQITVEQGATLALGSDINHPGAGGITGGKVTVSGTLTLDHALISGAAVTNNLTGEIDLNGSSALTGGTLGNAGVLKVKGAGNALHNETVTANNTIEVATGAILTVDLISTIANGGTLTIDDGGKLVLNAATIDGGIINNFSDVIGGTIDVTGDSKIDGHATLNNGSVTVENATLTLDDVTVKGATMTEMVSGSQIQVDGSHTLTLDTGATIQGNGVKGKISNGGTIEITGAAKLSNDTVTNSGTIQVDGGKTLTLNGTEITGGTINDFSGANLNGTIDVTGDSAIDGNATLNKGFVTIETATLMLDDVTVNGTTITEEASGSLILVEGGHNLTLGDATTIQGNGVKGKISNGGAIEIAGAAKLSNDTVTNSGTIQVDGGKTLTLNGTEITGGTINDFSGANLNGTIDVTGDSAIDGNATLNKGVVTVESATLTLDDVTVNGTSITQETNSSQIQVTGGHTLKLQQGASINGGGLSIAALGIVDLESWAALNGVTVTGSGTLRIDNAVTPTGTVLDGTSVDGVAISVGPVGTLEIGALGATFTDLSVTMSVGGKLEVDDGATLNLFGVTIDGGVINDFSGAAGGTIDVIGSSTIKGDATLNNGFVTVESATLTLDDVSVNGTTILEEFSGSHIKVDDTHKLTLGDGTTIQGVGAKGAIDNGGTIEIAGSATLSNDTLTNTGTIQVDDGVKLTLTATEITGGIINDFNGKAGGTIDVTGNSTIDGHATLNGGFVTVESATLTLDDVTVSGTTITETAADSVVQIENGHTLNLDNSTITGGALNIEGALNSTGNSFITDVAIDNTANIHVSGGTLTIDPTPTFDNSGTILVTDGGTLVLDQEIISNGAAGKIQVDTAPGHVSALDLNDSSIQGGSVTVSGLLDSTGTSAISSTITNNGTIEVENGTLTLGGSVSGSGHILIDVGATLALSGSDAQEIDFAAGGDSKLELLAGSSLGPGAILKGLSAGDEIDLSTIDYKLASATLVNGKLEVTDGSHTVDLMLDGDFSNLYFAGTNDGTGGTLVTIKDTDDAPVIPLADKSETGTITELSSSTGSSHTDSTGGTIHFTDIDLTDRPTATIETNTETISWTGAGAGSLTSSQVADLEHALSLTQSGKNNGAINWTYAIADKQLDFLGANQTLTLTANIDVDDHHAGGVTTTSVTVTIHGSEDAPSIVSETNPSTQTVILEAPPIVLSAGVITNSLGLQEDTFNAFNVGLPNDRARHDDYDSTVLGAHFDGSGDAGFAHGSTSGVSAAPFLGTGVDPKTYLSVGGGGSETITFDHLQNAFGLYWGSVDPGNTISFYDGNKLVASYSGGDIAPLIANGNQGSFASNGYVEFKDLAPFDKVVLSSNANAFEVDNISAGYIADHHIQLANPVSGTMTVKDPDIGDTLTGSVTDPGVATYNGSTQLPAGLDLSALTKASAITFDSVISNGQSEVLHWTYNPTNANFDFLEPGDTLKLTFNAHVTDGTATVGNQPLTVNIVGTNSSSVQGTSGNDVFVNVGGGVAITGNGGSDTFQFKPGFGSATINDFNVNSDVINIDHTLFANFNAIIAGAHPSGNDTIITDAAHDQITLKGVHVGTLNQQDFHFV